MIVKTISVGVTEGDGVRVGVGVGVSVADGDGDAVAARVGKGVSIGADDAAPQPVKAMPLVNTISESTGRMNGNRTRYRGEGKYAVQSLSVGVAGVQ